MNDEISIKELINKIKYSIICTFRKWKLLLISSLLGMLIGWFYSISESNTYTKELTFTVENSKKLYLGDNTAISITGFDLLASNGENIFSNYNMLELFKSRTMIEKTLLTQVPKKNLTFADLYCTTENINHSNTTFNQKKTREQDSLLCEIYTDIKLNLIKITLEKSTIIKLELKYKNELFVKYFLKNLIDLVSKEYNELKSKKSKIDLLNLQNQVDSTKTLLNEMIRQKTINPINKIEIEANTKLLSELIKQAEFSKIALKKEIPLIQIIDNPTFPIKSIKSNSLANTCLGAVVFYLLSFTILFVLTFFKNIDA